MCGKSLKPGGDPPQAPKPRQRRAFARPTRQQRAAIRFHLREFMREMANYDISGLMQRAAADAANRENTEGQGSVDTKGPGSVASEAPAASSEGNNNGPAPSWQRDLLEIERLAADGFVTNDDSDDETWYPPGEAPEKQNR